MRLILFLILTLTFGNVYSQTLQFEEIQSSLAPFTGVSYGSSAFADIDGDNDEDVLITGKNSSEQAITKLYLNNGNGNFTLVSGTAFENVWQGSVAFADIDGDSDKDVLITGINNSNLYIAALYKNNGNGVFTIASTNPFTGVFRSSVAFADIDNDNDQDLVVTGQGDANPINTFLYLNNGFGNFTEVTGTALEQISSGAVGFIDIDGDLDKDLFMLGSNNAAQKISKLYINNGSGLFTLANGTPFEGVNKGAVAFGDIDNDNDNDILIAGINSSFENITKLYRNNGSLSFSEITQNNFVGVSYSDVDFADFDKDNDLDIILSGDPNSTKLYSNNGTGIFSQVSGLPFVDVSASSIAVADIDGDNDKDVLVTGWDYNQFTSKLYRNISLFSCQPTSKTLDISSCNSYTAPNNVIYSSSGQYIVTIPNAAGCDSTITINLTINSSYSSTVDTTSFVPILGLNNESLTLSGIYTYNYQTTGGCDSTIIWNFTLTEPILPFDTLTFEQPFFTSNWLENGLNWYFADGWGDIRGYAAHSGGFSAMTISGSENKLISSQPINIKGLYLQLQGNPDFSVSQPHIYGYDAQGGLLYDSTLNSSFVYSFQFLELNWQNVSQIRITSPRGRCYSYPNFYWCDQVNIFYDDIIYTTVPVIDTLPPVINCPAPISACTFFEVPDYQAILDVSDNTTNRNQISIYQSIPTGTLLYNDTTLVITATDLAGNIDTCTILVQIQAPIDIPVIALTTSEICSGTATSISATGCVNGTIYWSNGQTGQSISISPLVDTSYTAICKKFNCISDSSNSVTVSVIQSPTAPQLSVANRVVLCKGDSLQIIASGCEPASLVWSNGAMGDSILVKPNQNNILSVHCTQNGCNSPSTSVNIEVYEKPIIIADTTDLCADSTITLHARGINNTTKLQWYKDGVALEGATDSLLNISAAGNYSVASMKAGNQTEWVRQNPDSENNSFTNTQLREVHFIDDKRGWALGVSQVFYTSDGGKNWSIQITGNYEEYWNKIQMLNDTLGYISSGKGNVIKTTNGGQTWTYLPTGTNSFLYGIHFIDTLEGWAVGSQGTVIKTIDGGNTWNAVTTPISGTSKSALSVHFLNENKGFIGLNEVFETLVTTDGGQTWSNDPSLAYIWEYQFLNDSTGYSLGAGGLRKTIDAGQNWVTSIYNLNDFNFINDSLGFIVDSQNQFFKTTNSGATWTNLPVTVSGTILSIDFISENQGWAVGNGGQILKFQPKLEVACLSDSINISNTLSAPQITSLPQTICDGQTVNLTATGCINGTIKWNTNQTGNTIAVQPATSQIYKAVCQHFSCISDSSNAVLISVNPSPTAPVLSVGDTIICKGDSLIISAQGCLNGTVIWSNSYSGSSQIIYPTQTTTLSAYCQPSTGCQSTNSIIHITVFEKPYIFTDTTNLCADSTITLRARGISNTTQLQWYKDGAIIEGATDSLLTITSAGNYSVASMKVGNQSEWVWLNPSSIDNTLIPSNIKQIDFIDSKTGFAISDGGIFKTINGGLQWQLQKSGSFSKIQLLNKDLAFAKGNDNILYKTTNGGISWEAKTTDSSNWLLDFSFKDSLNGIISYGNFNMLKTNDAGESWVNFPYPPQVLGEVIFKVNYLTNDNVNIIGFYGTFFRTINSGQSWTSSNYENFGKYVKAVEFLDSSNGFILNSNLNKTVDSGNSWQINQSQINAFKFLNNSIGWLGNSQGEILKTTNSGNSWINTQSPILNNIRAIDFVNENEGWAVGDAGQILKFQPKLEVACTSDSINISNTLSAPQIISLSQTICGGQTVNLTATGCINGTIKWNTNQTGSTIAVQPAISQIYKAVCQQFSCISDSSNAVLISVNPSPAAPILSIGDTTICKGDSLIISANGCTNGTIVWSNSYSGSSQIIYPTQTTTLSAYCQSSNGCQSVNNTIHVTVFEKPYIYSQTLNLCSTPQITLKARGISAATQLQWFKNGLPILGAIDSTLEITTQGYYSVGNMQNVGLSEWIWQNPNQANMSFTNSQLRDVSFVNANKGWAIGGSQVFHTENGGKTWFPQTVNAGDYWNKLQMIDMTTGYAAGGSGTIIKTTNGGQTWNALATGTTKYLYSLHFTDTQNGWAVGEQGTVIHTIDGGNTWTSPTTPITGTYNVGEGVYFKNNLIGFIGISGYGYMLKTTDGGNTWTTQYGITAYTGKFQFTSNNIGYLMGNEMMKTTDGGNTWFNIGDYANDFVFVNDTLGWKAGPQGSVLKTSNGGATWSNMNAPTGNNIRAIDFISENEGWAVGDGGQVLKFQPKLLLVCKSDSILINKTVIAPQITTLSQNICSGKGVSLSATGCSGGTIKWNNNQTGSTISVQPAFTTSYRTICQQNSCTSDSSNFVIITVKPKSFSTISVSKCDKFISPSGKFTYTTSGIYKDTLNNSVGCDSIITINLTIKRSTYSTTTLSICESYISPSGRFTWTTSGMYKDTIPNAVGCDSIITINLNIIKKAGAIISGNKIIGTGQSATLSVTLSGTAPYTLTINGVVYSNINQQNFSFNVSPTQTTTYAISSVTNNTCGIGTWSGSAIVTVDSNNPCLSVREIPAGNAASGTYNAAETVKSVGIVANPTTYKAGKSIELNPGFKADSGVVFKAEISGCN